MPNGETPKATASAQTGHDTQGYIAVNGLNMYYETHGTGRPLVLLHGALSETQSSFGNILAPLAKTRKVIAVEQQAHGHTADIDRPFSYRQMGEDTAALLRHLRIENADFFGYSMGGAIALELALRNPELVRKLVFAGGVSYSPDGLYPELLAGMDQMKPEDLDGSEWQKAYARVAPNPDNWHSLIEKNKTHDLEYAGWSPETIKSLKAPTLLIIGDSDIVRPEHVVEMFRLLGGGVIGDLVGVPPSQLAILPGTTHVTLKDRADWLFPMITEFLDVPMPEARG